MIQRLRPADNAVRQGQSEGVASGARVGVWEGQRNEKCSEPDQVNTYKANKATWRV